MNIYYADSFIRYYYLIISSIIVDYKE